MTFSTVPVNIGDVPYLHDISAQLLPDSMIRELVEPVTEEAAANDREHGQQPITALTMWGRQRTMVQTMKGQEPVTLPAIVGIQATVLLNLRELATVGAHLGRLVGALNKHYQAQYRILLGEQYLRLLDVPIVATDGEAEISQLTPDDFAKQPAES